MPEQIEANKERLNHIIDNLCTYETVCYILMDECDHECFTCPFDDRSVFSESRKGLIEWLRGKSFKEAKEIAQKAIKESK